jgi:hypothetical protein
MAKILFEGNEFDIGVELTAGCVIGAACVHYGEPGDFSRFKLFDSHGREVQPTEMVGERCLALCDVRKLRAQSKIEDDRPADKRSIVLSGDPLKKKCERGARIDSAVGFAKTQPS